MRFIVNKIQLYLGQPLECASLILTILVMMTSSEIALAIDVWQGNLKREFTMPRGDKNGQVMSYRATPLNLTAPAFDIDQEGNFYVLDPGNFRIQKFSPDGRHIRNLDIIGLLDKDDYRGWLSDVTVDGNGIVYLTYLRDFAEPRPDCIFKMDSVGILVDSVNLPRREHPAGCGISVDFQDHLFVHVNSKLKTIIYDNNLEALTEFESSSTSKPVTVAQIVQKADSAGQLAYAKDGYLFMTTLDRLIRGALPDSFMLPGELTDRYCDLIGLDNDRNIYFSREHHYTKPGRVSMTYDMDQPVTSIHRLLVIHGQLFETGELWISFYEEGTASDEERKDDVRGFVKRYVVNGAGEIYFLNGTIEKLHLDRLTFNR